MNFMKKKKYVFVKPKDKEVGFNPILCRNKYCDNCNQWGAVETMHCKSEDIYVKKYDYFMKDLFEKHVEMLQFLSKQTDIDFVPNFSFVDYSNLEYGMVNCGEIINVENEELEKIMIKMCHKLKSHGVYHNDIHRLNIVKNKKEDIYLIDWEHVDYNNKITGDADFCKQICTNVQSSDF